MSAESFTLVGVISAIAAVFIFLATITGVVIAYIRYRSDREREREHRVLESHSLHSEHHQRITILERDFSELRKTVDNIGARLEQVHRNTEELLKQLVSRK